MRTGIGLRQAQRVALPVIRLAAPLTVAWSKESRQARGYGAAWDRVRKLVMARDCGLCQVCRKAAARQVDHKVSKAKAATLRWTQAQIDHPDNLQAICVPCHEKKTEAEQGKTKKARVEIGLDGWPIEKK